MARARQSPPSAYVYKRRWQRPSIHLYVLWNLRDWMSCNYFLRENYYTAVHKTHAAELPLCLRGLPHGVSAVSHRPSKRANFSPFRACLAAVFLDVTGSFPSPTKVLRSRLTMFFLNAAATPDAYGASRRSDEQPGVIWGFSVSFPWVAEPKTRSTLRCQPCLLGQPRFWFPGQSVVKFFIGSACVGRRGSSSGVSR